MYHADDLCCVAVSTSASGVVEASRRNNHKRKIIGTDSVLSQQIIALKVVQPSRLTAIGSRSFRPATAALLRVLEGYKIYRI